METHHNKYDKNKIKQFKSYYVVWKPGWSEPEKKAADDVLIVLCSMETWYPNDILITS